MKYYNVDQEIDELRAWSVNNKKVAHGFKLNEQLIEIERTNKSMIKKIGEMNEKRESNRTQLRDDYGLALINEKMSLNK